ncbi:MAG: transcription termination/antitermination protein NusG [bacterium]
MSSEQEEGSTVVEENPEEAGENVEEPSSGQKEAQDEESDDPEQQANWYVLHTFAGQEQQIKQQIEDKVTKEGLEDVVFDVVVPTKDVMEIKKGEKQEVEKQLYPGYVFIKMVMSEQNWHTIRQTNGVTGFVGTQMDPIPVEETEMGEVLSQIGKGESEPQVEFSVGDTVRIISGAMEEMTGTVKEVDIEKAQLHVSVDMFGRSTPVELNFDQAEKL